MADPGLTFSSRDEHRAWLARQAALPRGFRTGSHRFAFTPYEVDKPAMMTITLIALDRPTAAFAGLFTRNAMPGAPIIVGRQRLAETAVSAIVINNKISNVCLPGGVETAERICRAAGTVLGVDGRQVIPCSTGVIGWRLPEREMIDALPLAGAQLQDRSILPAAEGIVTTDLYPKIRRRDIAGGSIIGIAKGAGMIEPNLATMLVYILTDLVVSREVLRDALATACSSTFNCMSIDSDTSTSDTVLALSSMQVPCPDLEAFTAALVGLCAELAEDIARNGEGVHHVIRVRVAGSPEVGIARAIGKSVVNSPLFQCAVCGNDPNVGRLVMAIGKQVGVGDSPLDLSGLRIRMGGLTILDQGAFRLEPSLERQLVDHLRGAELYASREPVNGVFSPPIDFPPHERCVEIDIDLGIGDVAETILGTDRSHEYISENADYRS